MNRTSRSSRCGALFAMAGYAPFALAVVLAGLGAGCRSEARREPSSAGHPSTVATAGAPPPSTGESFAPAVDAAVDAAWIPTPVGLPPFGPAPRSDPARSLSLVERLDLRPPVSDWRRATVGWDDAEVSDAIEAVKADPGSPRGRAVLAMLIGDERFAIEQLSPLIDAKDCPACADVLLNLRLWNGWPPSVVALADRARPGRRRVAVDALLDPDRTADIERYVDARRVKVVGRTGPKPTADELVQLLVSDDDRYCQGDCCTFWLPNDSHADRLERVCFAPGADRVTELRIQAGSH